MYIDCVEMRMDIYLLVVWTGRSEYEKLDSVYLYLELCGDESLNSRAVHFPV